MKHERLRRLARFVDAVEALHVVGGAERDCDERLGLSAREQRGAVRAWQNLGVDRDRADIVRAAAVDALAGVEHLRAKRVVLDVADERRDVLRVVRELGEQLLDRSAFFTSSTASMRVCLSF